MSLFNTLRRALGFNTGDNLEEDTQISSFEDAGMTGDETTGATSGTIGTTGTLPQNVVNNLPPTNTGTQTGGGTPPPTFATPGIVGGGMGNPSVNVLNNQIVETVNDKGVKSKSIQDLLEIGGAGFDDEVLARKLRRQAGMPELKNEDYYPNQPFTQAQTAWGDPIFSGAGALFPMTAYDAQRKARAQAELDEARRDVMQIKIPEIKTGAYVERLKTGFIDEVSNLTNDYVNKYGNSKKAIRAMSQDGSLAKLQFKYEGIARSIDQTADRAKEFLKNAQEKAATMYYSPEGVRAATNFMNGMDAYSKGLITPEQLNQLEQQFNTADKWDTYKKNALDNFSDDEIVPGLTGDKLSPEEDDAFQKQINLPGGLKDHRHFLLITKYSTANKAKIIEGIVKPFFDTNPTAFEQLRQGNEKPEETVDRIANSIVAMRGNKIYENVISQSEKKGININNSQPTKKTFYQSIDEKKGEIMSEAMKVKPANVAQAKQIAEQIYGGGTADDFFFGVRAFDWPSINKTIASMPYSELYKPNASDVGTKQEVFFGKVNKIDEGIPETNTTAKNLKVQGVVNVFISKGKDGNIRVFSNEDMVNKPLTADYKPYLMQVVTDEKYETSGSNIDPNDMKSMLDNIGKGNQKSLPTSGIYYRFVPLDKSTATTMDKVADMSGQFTGGTDDIKVTGDVVEDFD